MYLSAGALVLAGAAPALAGPIAAGSTISNVNVAGSASIYYVFGHDGSTGGPADTPAVQTTFAAGTGNVFSFTASGLVSCCGDAPNFGPDGGASATNITGLNGLSSLSGDSYIPLVGVFTSETDPFGGSAPAALSFSAATAGSLSPLLNQVFYIGDGRAGLNNAAGAILQFTAPTNATRLYLGVVDGFSFVGQSSYYGDNGGAYLVNVSLASAVGAVPEPASWAMMIAGFGLVGGALRRRRAGALALA